VEVVLSEETHMTKLITMTVVAVLAVGSVAMARTQSKKVTDAEVQSAIDTRLHQLLVDLNAKHTR
jgi:hypothetical protein